MLTVSILINGQPLYTRSCFREKWGKYKCDNGDIITHNYDDGAVALAHKLLDTITELKRPKINPEEIGKILLKLEKDKKKS